MVNDAGRLSDDGAATGESVSVLAGLTPAERAAVIRSMEPRTYNAGATVLVEGEAPRWAHSHTADIRLPFAQQVISTNDREALYVINALCNHETGLHIQEHFTDTHGYTTQSPGPSLPASGVSSVTGLSRTRCIGRSACIC